MEENTTLEEEPKVPEEETPETEEI